MHMNMNVKHPRLIALLCLVPLAWGCPDDPPVNGDSGPPPRQDTGPEDDSGTLPGANWTTEVVATDDVGRYASLDVADDGTVGMVYFAVQSRDDGLCTEVTGDQPQRTRFPLYYAQLEPDAADWSTELVAEPLHLLSPVGVSFLFSPSGVPSVAMFGGEPIDVLCSANDALFGTRDSLGDWNFEPAATESADTPVPGEDDACRPAASNAGYTVGQWPALAFDNSGQPAIAYQDTHMGTMQRDDVMRADAELAYRQGGWTHHMVDCSVGGGINNSLVFDTDDRPVVLHRIARDDTTNPRHGLWVTRRESNGAWLRTMLATGRTEVQESSLAAGADNRVAVIYYDPGSTHPWVAELEDTVRFADGASWLQVELGNNAYEEGQYPSTAWSPDGTLAVAYYRCARNGGDGSCDADHDALIYAWRTAAGLWRYETVDEGGTGHCGTHTSLAFGPDGTAWIAYACVRQEGSSEFISEIKVARRSVL
jgi:hypothetical protein